MDITEHRLTEEALRKSEEKYRLLFEKMINGFALHEIVLNKKGEAVNYKYLEVNTAFEKITNQNRNDVIGKMVTEVIPGVEKDPADWIGKYANVALTGQEISFEQYGETLGKWFSVTAFSQKKGQFATIFEDITRRKKAEEALLLSKERNDLALTVNNDGYYDWNISSNNVFFDPRFYTMAGYKPNEFPGHFEEWANRVHPEDLVSVEKKLNDYIVEKIPEYDVEFRFKRKEGDWMWIRSRAKVLGHDKNNAPLRLIGTHTDITTQKLAQIKLNESQEGYRKLMDSSVIGLLRFAYKKVLRVDLPLEEQIQLLMENSYAFECNDVFAQMNGFKNSEEIIGLSAVELSHSEETARDQARQYITNGYQWINQLTSKVTPQGEKKYSISNIISTYKTDNEIDGCWTSVVDVTERMRISESYKLLFENLPIGAFKTSIDDVFIDANQACAEIFGYESAEDLKKSIKSISNTVYLNPEDRTFAQQKIQSNEIVNIETAFKRKDGSLFVGNIFGRKIMEGNDIFFEGTIEDITEKQKHREALKTSERKFRRLIEQAPDAVYLFNNSGEIIDTNLKATEDLGYTLEEIKAMNVLDIDEELSDIKDLTALLSQLSSKETSSTYRRQKKKDGSLFPVELHVSVIDHDEAKLYLTFVRDMTESMRLKDKLENTNQELTKLTRHIQELREEERMHLAREIHDDLGQILTALKFDLISIRDYCTPNIEIKQRIESALNLNTSAIKTTQNITRELRPGMIDDLGIIPAVEWYTGQFSERTNIHIDLIIKTDEPNIEESYKINIYRIIQEALTNIARHAEATKVKIAFERTNEGLQILIRDNGKGITEEDMKRPDSFGLIGMKERANAIKGELKIIFGKKQGTEVNLFVPFKKDVV